MFYSLDLADHPIVKKIYTVTRNTVWQISEPEHLLVFIRDGECTVTVDGENIALSDGDVLYLPPGKAYIRRPCGEKMCTMVYIHFTTEKKPEERDGMILGEQLSQIKKELDDGILFGETDNKSFCNIFLQTKTHPQKSDAMYSDISDISPFSSGRHFMSRLLSSAKLCTLLAQLSEETVNALLTDNSLLRGEAVPQKLKKAVEYISGHYSEKIPLDGLASYCAVSKQQLIRYFKTAFGTTPNNYITQYKLARAKELLFNCPYLTIKEIAAELGFDDQHYFARVFAKYCGETPSAFRFRTVNYDDTSENSDN